MTKFNGLFDVRDAHMGDANFVLATLLRGLYYGDTWFSAIPKGVFMDNYKLIAQALVSSPNTIVKIACLPDDPNVILGYSVMSSDFLTVHFVYVKAAWRLKGIARALTPTHPQTVSHLTRLGQTLLPKINNPIFNPFKLNL